MANLPETASDLFDTLLPLGVKFYADRVRDIGGAFIFDIEGAGVWVLDTQSTPPSISKGSPSVEFQNSCTIEMSHDSLKAIMKDYKSGIDLYFANKIKVSGNVELALGLQTFFEITRPNPG